MAKTGETVKVAITLPWWVLRVAFPVWAGVMLVAHLTCPRCIDLDLEGARFAAWVARRCKVGVVK